MVDSIRSCMPPRWRKVRRRLDVVSRSFFTQGVNYLGPPIAFGFGLTTHGSAHAFGQLDVFDRDHGDLDAPRVGDIVDELFEPQVDRVALAEVVQLYLRERDTPRWT